MTAGSHGSARGWNQICDEMDVSRPAPRPSRALSATNRAWAPGREATALSAMVGTVYDAALDPDGGRGRQLRPALSLDRRYGAFGAADRLRERG